MKLTLNPMFGWIISPLIALLLVCFAVWLIIDRVRQSRKQSTLTNASTASLIRRVLLLVLSALMVMTPSLLTENTTKAVKATDVFIAVDTTGSMAVSDAHYKSEKTLTRLAAARQAITDIASMYSDASFSAISFGASTTIDLPMTPDSNAVTQWANTLVTEATATSRGSSLDAPINTLITAMKKTRQAHPNDSIVLYYISDGESTTDEPRRTFSSLRKYVTHAVVVGVGSSTGGKIPLTKVGINAMDDEANAGMASQGSDSAQTEWVKDPTSGKDGISHLNPENLKAIADELSGLYVQTSSKRGLEITDVGKTSQSYHLRSVIRHLNHTVPFIWPLVIAFFLIFLWELGTWLIMSRRLL